MDVDSLICLNSVEKSSFDILRLKNAKKSLSEIFKTLEESIDFAVQDAGEDKILLNSDRIPNSLEKNSSSITALGDIIQVFTSTIQELNNISEKRKTHLEPSDELLIPDKDVITENSNKNTNPPEKMNDIRNRYPELFDIFSEESKSQISNLGLQSEIKASEKCVKNLDGTFPNYFHNSKVYFDDAEVTSDKNSTFKPIMIEQFHQKSVGSIKKEFLPEKMYSSDFQNNPERLERERIFLSSTVLTARTETSNSSSGSWGTLKDTPRNGENNFPEASFDSKSICKLEVDSKKVNLGIKSGKQKSKTGDRTRVKKKKLSLNVEKVQGDTALKKSRVLAVKSDTEINKEEKKDKRILMNILDILLEVKSNLFSNRKFADALQERFQNSSLLQSVVSLDAIESLSEEISRCTIMRIRKNHEVIIGLEELLLDSVLRLEEAVKEEKDYLKQQEYYYKQFSELSQNKRRTGNLKRTTVHTLIGNDSSLSLTQKEKIEELIFYTISLIQKILPKQDSKIRSESSCQRDPTRHVKTEADPRTQIEIFSRKRKMEENLKNEIENNRSKPRMDPTFIKVNPETLKINKKYLSNEKMTRSSTLVMDGINKDSKQSSNQAIKMTNKGRCQNTSQPIWKPAGNVKAKTTVPVQGILRQKTRQNLPSDKKDEKLNEGVTRNQQSSKHLSANESTRNSKLHVQKSSTNLKSDIQKKSDTKCFKGQKKETHCKSKSETRDSNFLSKNQQDPQKENCNLNRQVLKTKRKFKQPEAIQLLKELIKSTSEEENLSDRKATSSNSLETSKCDLSVRFLKSENKIDFSRSSFASTSMIKQGNSKNPSKVEFNVQSSENMSRSENPLKPLIQLEEEKSKVLKTSSARIPKSVSKNSLLKNFDKSSTSRIIDSRSKTIIKDNKLEDKESNNLSLHSSRSNLSSSETRFPKNYLKKNPSNSSYLQSYIKLNSRQNHASSSVIVSSKSEVKKEKSEITFDHLFENEADEAEEIQIDHKIKSEEKEASDSSKSNLIDSNLELDLPFLPETIKSSESLTKNSSSKYCQVSFEPSISSRISGETCSEDFDQNIQNVETEVCFLDCKSSQPLSAQKKKGSSNKQTKSFLILKDILQNHGLDVDLVDEAERKLRSKERGTKSIYYDKGDGTLLAISSSKTLFDKLASLSDSSFEELEIKDLESLDQEVQASESQEYFQIKETSLSSLSAKKSRSSHSKYSLFLSNKQVESSEQAGIFSQASLSSKKSEESQTLSVKNIYTETESFLENRVFTDVEVSCTLESSFSLRKEASTEVSFERCFEAETQTNCNLEKYTNTDFDWMNQEIDSNFTGINIEKEKYSEMDSFLENEKLCKINEEISVNSSSNENINEEVTLEKFKKYSEIENLVRFSEVTEDNSLKEKIDRNKKNDLEDTEKESKNDNIKICKTHQDQDFIDPKEEKKDQKQEIQFEDVEEESGKDNKKICIINKNDSFLKEEMNNGNIEIDLNDIEEESRKDKTNIFEINQDQADDSFSKEEIGDGNEKIELETVVEESSEDNANIFKMYQDQERDYFSKEEIIFQNIKEESEDHNANICRFIQDKDAYFLKEEAYDGKEEIKFDDIFSKEETNDGKEARLQNIGEEFEVSTIESLSKKNEENEENEETKFRNFEEDSAKKVFEEDIFSHELIPNSGENEDMDKENEEMEGSYEVSVPIYTLSKSQIPNLKSLESEEKPKNEEIIKLISKLEVTPSFLVFCNEKIRNNERIKNFKQFQFSKSYNKISQIKDVKRSSNLAVETLKLATKRARNLYEGAKSFREKMKPFEEPKREEENFYLKQKREAEDIKNDLYVKEIISEKKVLGSENFLLEKKPKFLTISNFKKEKSLNPFPEVREVMTYLLKNVEKNLEKKVETFNLEQINEEEDFKLQFENHFSLFSLLPIFVIIFWCFYSSIYEV
ncbi:uncharacterized protein LOC117181565 isoform X2 [Belonocnema kinseyi]|uniref:uncharacterized protein LOC117181565 isoform X2 n=1 Tax=Belonocnema kinseyi TaxID=2817044 RepID=UPI00143D5EAA|nr:uncharacterized protein LOC117181565 isoform X2 [Belonocnema kinseyi]